MESFDGLADAGDFGTPVELDRLMPTLALWEESIRTAEPDMAREQVLDRALKAALANLHYDLSKETIAYLLWKVRKSRAEAAAVLEASIAARKKRLEAQVRLSVPEIPGTADTQNVVFRDITGRVWRVREIIPAPTAWTQGRSCLLFESEDAIRRVWRYPADWARLPDEELEELSWQR